MIPLITEKLFTFRVAKIPLTMNNLPNPNMYLAEFCKVKLALKVKKNVCQLKKINLENFKLTSNEVVVIVLGRDSNIDWGSGQSQYTSNADKSSLLTIRYCRTACKMRTIPRHTRLPNIISTLII